MNHTQSLNMTNLRRSSSLKERRSTSHSCIQERHSDSDDSTSAYSVPAIVPRKTRSSTLRRHFTLNCERTSKYSQEDVHNYLTPTQRYERQIHQFRVSQKKLQKQCDEKDDEINRLNDILIENGLGDATKKCNDITVINEESIDDNEIPGDKCADRNELCDSGVVTDETGDSIMYVESLAAEHEKEIQRLKSHHANDMQTCKENHNNKVESLLSRISEMNAKHCDLRELYDAISDKSRDLEREIEKLKQTAEEKEKHHHQMYVKMYKKGQDAAKFEHADELDQLENNISDNMTVPDLLHQLRLTEHELNRVKRLYQRAVYNNRGEYNPKGNGEKSEKGIITKSNMDLPYMKNMESDITLNFLRDVVYHYFTDRDHSCSEGHLRALISILDYNEKEKKCIEKGIKKKRRIV